MSTSTNKEIVGLEEKYWQAMRNSDVETAISLTRFPCIVTSPMGTRRMTEEDYRNMMKGHPMGDFQESQILSPEVEFLNDHTAVITYNTEFHGMKMVDVSTWIKEDGKWLFAFHSENPKRSDLRH